VGPGAGTGLALGRTATRRVRVPQRRGCAFFDHGAAKAAVSKAVGGLGAFLFQQQLAELAGTGRGRRVTLVRRHDGALHQDVPFPRE